MKFSKSFLIPVLLAPLAAACGDSPDQVENSRPNPDPGSRPEVTDYYVSPSVSGCVTEIQQQPGEGIEAVIGHGYDVTGDYLAPASVRPLVVDVTRMTDDAFTIFSAPAFNSGETYIGTDAANLLTDLMAGMGETPEGSDYYFTGMTSGFPSNSSYVMETRWQRAYIAGFPGTTATSRRYLSDEFTADLALLTADGLVRKYGTHFISRASFGLAFRQLYCAYIPSSDNDITPLTQGFRAASSAMAGTYSGILSEELASLYNYGARLRVTLCGGDTDGVELDEKGILRNSEGWWTSQCDVSDCGLIGISDIRPLSDAIADNNLASEVDKAARKYIREAQTKADGVLPLFQNSDGKVYRYVTSAEASAALDKSGIKAYGVLGALSSVKTTETPLALYSKIDGGGNQILSVIQPDDDWKLIGYVMDKRTASSVSLYEISDGTRFAYTIEAANSYGKRNEWHPTGATYHLLRP